MNPVQTPADLRPLTSLRFWAAIWVALYTFWPNLDAGFVPLLTTKGYLGVELFFVLSGFILSHVYLAAFGEKRFRYRSFIWARVARVYPLHLVTLLGVMALGLVAVAMDLNIDASVLSWKTLVPNLLMVHAWGFASESGWNHPSWSISAEWLAYLTFPIFATGAWALRTKPWLAVALTAAGLIATYLVFERLAGFPLTQATFNWGGLRILPCFAFGCALYLAYRHAPLPRPRLLALMALGVVLASASITAWDGITVLACGLMILALASIPVGQAKILGSVPAVYLGEISYALYMVCAPWQMLSVNLAARFSGAETKALPLVWWLMVMVGLVVVAAIAHHIVERPARNWLRKFALSRHESTVQPPQQSETVFHNPHPLG
jgi:peptidoglycan/LPS O-acetylase OafA/YrhL